MIGIFITAEAFIEGYRGSFHKNSKFSIFSKNPICHPPQGIRQLGTETNSRLQLCVGYDFCVYCVQLFTNNILSISFSFFPSIDWLWCI